MTRCQGRNSGPEWANIIEAWCQATNRSQVLSGRLGPTMPSMLVVTPVNCAFSDRAAWTYFCRPAALARMFARPGIAFLPGNGLLRWPLATRSRLVRALTAGRVRPTRRMAVMRGRLFLAHLSEVVGERVDHGTHQ